MLLKKTTKKSQGIKLYLDTFALHVGIGASSSRPMFFLIMWEENHEGIEKN
jgi:hypothetical protein